MIINQEKQKMAGNKTRDGFRIADVARSVSRLFGIIEVRNGDRHPFVLSYPGMFPCALACSTDVRRQISPWIAQVTGYSSNQVYQAIRSGRL